MDDWTKRRDALVKRKQLRERAVAHMGGGCVLCGYNRCLAALDFHHVEGAAKDFDISSRMSWARIEAELRKCVLLCSNCHREVHQGFHPRFLMDETDDRGGD